MSEKKIFNRKWEQIWKSRQTSQSWLAEPNFITSRNSVKWPQKGRISILYNRWQELTEYEFLNYTKELYISHLRIRSSFTLIGSWLNLGFRNAIPWNEGELWKDETRSRYTHFKPIVWNAKEWTSEGLQSGRSIPDVYVGKWQKSMTCMVWCE